MFQGTGFGGSTNSPFGSTTYKPATSVFNSGPMFSTGGSSLFGSNTTQPSTGLFGSTTTPAFGQTQPQQNSFGGFTATSNAGTGLFGQQQNANTGGLFGSSSTPFGQNKPAFGGFGTTNQSTGLFGQQATSAQPNQPLFGQPQAQQTTGLFGASTAFGGGAGAAGGGTTLKFTPVTGSDTMVKNGVSSQISTRHHCITCMKEYESKSLEELRLEDYAANRKGPQQGGQTGGLFGAPAQQPSLFGAPSSTASTGLFGSTTDNKSVFGATSTGFGGGNTSMFGGANTGGSMFNKPSAAATPFGTTPAASTANTNFGFNSNTSNNLFGSTPQTSGFNSFNTSQPSTGFGTQASGFSAFGTTQQQGGLFSQNKPTFNLGSNTSQGFSFGSTAPTSSTLTSSFTANKTTPFPTFGQPASTSSGFGQTGFGQTNPNQPSFFTNSFNKPTSTGFSFGNTTTTNTLGTGLNFGSGGSLFGQNQNKPGGLFNSGGGSSSLFGTNSSFSNNTFNTGSTGLGSSSFSFGNNQPTSSLLPSFGQNTAAPQNNALNQYMLALASMPFGDSPLFKNLVPSTSKSDEGLKTASPAAMKALQSGINHKVLPNSNSRVKIIKPNSMARNSLFDGLYDEEEDLNGSLNSGLEPSGLRTPRINARRLNLTRRPLITDNYNDNNNSYDLGTNGFPASPPASSDQSFTRLVKKNLLFQPDQLEDNETNRNSDGRVVSSPPPIKMKTSTLNNSRLLDISNTSLDTSVIEDPLHRRHVDGLMKRMEKNKLNIINLMNQSENKEPVEQPSTSTSSSGESEGEEFIGDGNDEPHATGITLTRAGYYTIPSLADLAQLMDSDGRCIVDNFTIGRLNYGNVFYPESFDVANVNLDKIVHFRHKEVVIYPDDGDKPPVGQGLNRRAQVTLDRVWPLDRNTRDPITDPARLQTIDFESKLRQASAKHGTRFIEYRPQTGSWVFKVDHFSKYGLTDSDEEEGGIDVKKSAKFASAVLVGKDQMQMPSDPTASDLYQHRQKMRKSMDAYFDSLSHHNFLEDEDEEMADEPFGLYDVDGVLGPTSKLSRQLGTSAHKLQLMKASFFEPSLPIGDEIVDPREDLFRSKGMESSGRYSNLPFCEQMDSSSLSLLRQPVTDLLPSDNFNRSLHLEKLDESGESGGGDMIVDIPGASSRLKVYPVEYGSKWLSNSETTVMSGGDSGYLADEVLARGLSFKPCWGPGGLLTSLSSHCPLLVNTLQVSTQNQSFHKESLIEQLEGALKCSVISTESGLPLALCPDGVATLTKHLSIARHQPSTDHMFLHAFALCHALWGHLPDIASEDTSYSIALSRRQAVSSWLETVTSPLAKADIDLRGDSPASVLSLMTCRSVLDACQLAISMGDKRMSLVLSQAGSSRIVRSLVERQLVEWRETQADRHIDSDRIKLYMLVAGRLTHQTSDLLVSVCSSLDWIRSFALHLWYVCWSTSSVPEALNEYDNAWNCESPNAPSPLPPHVSPSNDGTDNDNIPSSILYHLLKLFSDKSHPLDLLLNPNTHTSNSLDYTLSWLLMRVLMSLGYSHLSEYNVCLIHTSFASQLEMHGLWHWAIFVLLHIPTPERENLIRETLERHMIQEEDASKERFLKEKLKIPLTWIASAKATRAIHSNRYDEAAKNLLLAGNWNYAHEIIMKHIASSAMINEKYNMMEELLNEMEKEERYREILGWESGGLVLVEYLRGVKLIKSVRDSSQIHEVMDDLTTMASRLYIRIKLLPTALPIDRLCQRQLCERLAKLLPEIPLESVCMGEALLSDQGNIDQWQPWNKITLTNSPLVS